MPESNPTVARLKRLIAELETFGYSDLADEIRDDLTWWEKVGGSGGDLTADELQELAEAAGRVSWDTEGLTNMSRLGENDDEGSKK